jgi:hypothetical protein
MVQAVSTACKTKNAVRPDITRSPSFSVISRFLCLDFSNHKNKSKSKNIPASNKICDKLSKMWTLLYVIWFLKASCAAVGGCYVQLSLLLSVSGRTHHVNDWASQAGIFYNAESLLHISPLNPGVLRQRLALSVGSKWAGSIWWRRQFCLRNVVFQVKARTMDNAQKYDNYINIPPSQTYRKH